MLIRKNHLSSNYKFSIAADSVDDLYELQMLKENVSKLNKEIKQRNLRRAIYSPHLAPSRTQRVVVRGRHPKSKMDVRSFWGGYRKNASYDFGGNVVGGIHNAKIWDIYVYDR